MLTRVDALHTELQEVNEREARVEALLEQFQLTAAERDALRGDVTVKFLAALAKVRHVHEACKRLVSVEHQHAAVEIMEHMFLLHLSSCDKIAKYISNAAPDMLAGDTIEPQSLCIQALMALQEHPSHWMRALLEISRVRKASMVRRFFDAMAKGSSTSVTSAGKLVGGTSTGGSTSSGSGGQHGRPLEAYAHDAVRFTGDVCAWVHQCVAEENDAAALFFTPKSPPEFTRAHYLDAVGDGVAKHVRQRLESAISSAVLPNPNSGADGDAAGGSGTLSDGTTGGLGSLRRAAGGGVGPSVAGPTSASALLVLFRLDSLLSFYTDMLKALLGDSNPMTSSLRELRLDVMQAFFNGLQRTGTQLQHGVQLDALPSDLSVPPAVHAVLRLLRSLLESMNTSLVPHARREAEFAPVLSALVDPILSLSQAAAFDVSDPVTARFVLQLNMLSLLVILLVPFDFAAQRQEKLAAQLEAIAVAYVKRVGDATIAKVGLTRRLQDVVASVAAAAATEGSQRATVGDGSTDLPTSQSSDSSSNGVVDLSELRDGMQGFFSYIYSTGSLNLPLLEQIQNPKVKDRCRRDVTDRVCDAYAALYEATERVMGPRVKEALHHTPSELRLLLDVQKVEDEGRNTP